MIKAYGGSRLTALRKVQLIMALPNLFAALKIAAQSTADSPRLWYLALISGAWPAWPTP